MSQDKTLPELPEPQDYLFQNEDTGNIMTVDGQQVKWGFEENNPRWRRLGGSFSEAQMHAYGERCIAAHLERTGQSVTNDAVPALVQSRFLRDERHGWSRWQECDEDTLAGLRQTVEQNASEGWRYEVRRLYLHPATPPDLLEAAQAAWNCIAELAPTQARVEVAQLLQAAIEKAIGEQP